MHWQKLKWKANVIRKSWKREQDCEQRPAQSILKSGNKIGIVKEIGNGHQKNWLTTFGQRTGIPGVSKGGIMTALTEWANFYVIVGSSAGAMIGLQFVVMTLVADREVPTSQALGSAFATPSIVHFVAALLLSALVTAPWQGFATATLVW